MHAGNSRLLKTVDPFRWLLDNKRVFRFLSSQSFLLFLQLYLTHLISPSFSSHTHHFLFQSFAPTHFVKQSVWTGWLLSSPCPFWAFPLPQLLALELVGCSHFLGSVFRCLWPYSTPHAGIFPQTSWPLRREWRGVREEGEHTQEGLGDWW